MLKSESGVRGPDGARELPLVLAVDDDPQMLAALRRLLRSLPVRLVCLQSAEEALELLRVEAPAAIVSDHQLPGISGLELLAEVRCRWPQVRTLLHTGDPLARERAARLRQPVVEKGAQADSLRAFLLDVLSGSDERR